MTGPWTDDLAKEFQSICSELTQAGSTDLITHNETLHFILIELASTRVKLKELEKKNAELNGVQV